MHHKRKSGGFAPIELGEYVRSYLKNNHGSQKGEVT
jgi:hypothetical protein